MPNKLIALSLCVLILLSLCACKSETTQAEQTQAAQNSSSASNNSSNKPTSSVSSNSSALKQWQFAYLDYATIKNSNYVSFALVYIDNDDIPELYMSGNDEATGDAVCSIKNGTIIEQQLGRIGGGSYIEKSGKFANQNGNMGNLYTDVYTLNNGKFTKVLSASKFEKIETLENGDLEIAYDYCIGDKRVNTPDYDKAISDAFDFKNAKRLNENAVTYEEFKQLVENYK